MRVMMSDYLQAVKGNYRVKIEVPTHLPVYLPPPHTNKKFLVHGLGVSTRPAARKLSQPWIAEFKAAIEVARSAHAAAMLTAATAGEDWDARSRFSDRLDRALSEQYFRQIEINRGKGNLAAPAPAPTPEAYAQAVVAAMRNEEAAKTAYIPDGKAITFESVFERWSKGKSDAEVRNTRTEMGYFSAFIGSDDMRIAGRREFIEYRDRIVDQFHDQEISSKTASNRWRRLGALYASALNSDKDGLLVDHVSRIKLDITVESEGCEDFTRDEICRALLASREQTDPMVRWFQWLGVFLGLRDSEIMRAHKDSIKQINGVWCFCVLKKYGVKTKSSVRNIPLHQMIIGEGFLDYIQSLPEASRLFPNYTEHSIFDPLRDFYNDLGIEKRFYSLRHTLTTHFRFREDIDRDVKAYLLAHGRADAHARYGAYPAEKLVPAIETIPDPLKPLATVAPPQCELSPVVVPLRASVA